MRILNKSDLHGMVDIEKYDKNEEKKMSTTFISEKAVVQSFYERE